MGSRHSTSSILRKIDEKEGSVQHMTDRLFKKYDWNRSGMLEGREYDALIDELTTYMLEDFRAQGFSYDRYTVRSWVQQTLDGNRDGRISKSELRYNLKRILDADEAIVPPGMAPSCGCHTTPCQHVQCYQPGPCFSPQGCNPQQPCGHHSRPHTPVRAETPRRRFSLCRSRTPSKRHSTPHRCDSPHTPHSRCQSPHSRPEYVSVCTGGPGCSCQRCQLVPVYPIVNAPPYPSVDVPVYPNAYPTTVTYPSGAYDPVFKPPQAYNTQGAYAGSSMSPAFSPNAYATGPGLPQAHGLGAPDAESLAIMGQPLQYVGQPMQHAPQPMQYAAQPAPHAHHSVQYVAQPMQYGPPAVQYAEQPVQYPISV